LHIKVFLGWSGDTSQRVASAFHNWLPKVIQAIKPYISTEDIAKVARWSSEIAKELQNTNYGIVCVTKQNLNSAWINFEAGALSREIEKSFVTPPFLFDLRPSGTYAYDNVGNLQSYTYPNDVVTSYNYDQLYRLTQMGSAKGGALTSYTYRLGAAGNRTSVAELSGRTVTYGYDSLYRLTSETIVADPVVKNGTLGYVGTMRSATGSR
jgi:YD repeat-containing protein